MTSTGKFVYMAHHFILLRLNPFGLRVNREGWWFEHSMSQLQVCLSAEGAKNVSWPWLSPLRRWGNLTMAFTGKFVHMAHHSFCYGSIPLALGLAGRDGGLSTLCHSCNALLNIYHQGHVVCNLFFLIFFIFLLYISCSEKKTKTTIEYVKCYSSSGPTPAKSPSNSIRYNCQKICS